MVVLHQGRQSLPSPHAATHTAGMAWLRLKGPCVHAEHQGVGATEVPVRCKHAMCRAARPASCSMLLSTHHPLAAGQQGRAGQVKE